MRNAIALAIAVALTPAAAAAQGWTMVDIGTLGGAGSYAAAISNSGLAAGCSETRDGATHAFVYENGTLRDLGPGCALAVNDAGAAAGRSGSGDLQVWRGGKVVSLGVKSAIGGINDAGAVAGTREAGGTSRAFVWRDGTLTDLGTLDDTAAGARSEAAAINSRGQVAGSSNGRAFLHEAGRMRDLGTLGGSNSSARAISSRGEVAGSAANELGQPSAFAYSGSMRALPTPAYSTATGINAAGLVVGTTEGMGGFVLANGTLTRLEEIPAVAARGWRNLAPTGINDQGWIVGTGENAAGDLRAFLLVPSGTKPRRIAID